MPENYYCLDNFFQKMTDLESPRKNNDCYFYYYSTCTKGDNCTFRHEPSALGCETTCSFWKEGKCINVHCNFRHMELRKNRKTIPCYWESQPSGCKKPHCPFLHVSKKNVDDSHEEITSDEQDDLCNLKIKSGQDDFTAPVVDPLVVNFEEESDNESSTPTQSSHKTTNQSHDHLLAQHCHQLQQEHHHHEQFAQQANNKQLHLQCSLSPTNIVEVKTLEEIKLDRIQAESAAYYSYSDEPTLDNEEEVVEEVANGRARNVFKRLQPLASEKSKEKEVNIENIQVLTLDEIRKRKRKVNQSEEPPTDTMGTKIQKVKIEQQNVDIRPKKLLLNKNKPIGKDVAEIKIKTLAEIKAEKVLKRKYEGDNSQEEDDNDDDVLETQEQIDFSCSKKQKVEQVDDLGVQLMDAEQEVSSTSKTDENQTISSSQTLCQVPKVQCVVAPVKRHSDACEQVAHELEDAIIEPQANVEVGTSKSDVCISKISEIDEINDAQPVCSTNSTNVYVGEDELIKIEDESKLDELLLEDEDDEGGELSALSLKAEDDILNDIDNLLNE